MGTHLRVLSKSYPMNTNMTGLDNITGVLEKGAKFFWCRSLEILTANDYGKSQQTCVP